ncbi:DUF4405 domain-containing protein [Dokdonella sp.]|uniref:DUF4405 domain-containing protein n=1 Tax=Dokdonella sp. TaxID=2291710 RepID=UPI003C66F408
MFRKFVAITMFVSFVAMSTSGLLMIYMDRTSFTLQMHPVHKVFGVLLVLAAIAHITLNFRSLKAHVKNLSVAIMGAVLIAALVGLYAVALSRSIPADTAEALDALSGKAEQQMEGE